MVGGSGFFRFAPTGSTGCGSKDPKPTSTAEETEQFTVTPSSGFKLLDKIYGQC